MNLIKTMFVSLSRNDAKPDNSIVDVVREVSGRGFDIVRFKLQSEGGTRGLRLELVHIGRRAEAALRLEIAGVLGQAA